MKKQAGPTRPGKILSIVFILAILGTIGVLVYVTTVPKASEMFTEFYILGFESKAEGYPNAF